MSSFLSCQNTSLYKKILDIADTLWSYLPLHNIVNKEDNNNPFDEIQCNFQMPDKYARLKLGRRVVC